MHGWREDWRTEKGKSFPWLLLCNAILSKAELREMEMIKKKKEFACLVIVNTIDNHANTFKSQCKKIKRTLIKNVLNTLKPQWQGSKKGVNVWWFLVLIIFHQRFHHQFNTLIFFLQVIFNKIFSSLAFMLLLGTRVLCRISFARFYIIHLRFFPHVFLHFLVGYQVILMYVLLMITRMILCLCLDSALKYSIPSLFHSMFFFTLNWFWMEGFSMSNFLVSFFCNLLNLQSKFCNGTKHQAKRRQSTTI